MQIERNDAIFIATKFSIYFKFLKFLREIKIIFSDKS